MPIDASQRTPFDEGDAAETTDGADRPVPTSGADPVANRSESPDLAQALGEDDPDSPDPWALNLGGEGELPGRVVNVNLLSHAGADGKPVATTTRSLDSIKTSGQPVVQADMTALPFRDDAVEEVVGVRTPFMAGSWAEAVAAEAHRVVAPGGSARLHSTTTGGDGWGPYLEQAGFDDVSVKGGYATGTKDD